jgi:hypothetical protein
MSSLQLQGQRARATGRKGGKHSCIVTHTLQGSSRVYPLENSHWPTLASFCEAGAARCATYCKQICRPMALQSPSSMIVVIQRKRVNIAIATTLDCWKQHVAAECYTPAPTLRFTQLAPITTTWSCDVRTLITPPSA